MAYKFQYGTYNASGNLVQAGDLAVSGDGATDGNVSGSGDGRFLALDLDSDTNTLTSTTLGSNVVNSSLTSLGTIASLVATTADINGGTIDNAVIGGSTAAAGTFTTIVGTGLSVSDGNITNVGNIALDSISADGAALSIDSNWDAAGVTCSDLGSVTTCDINGGSIDGATVGAASQSSGKFTTLSASSTLSVVGAASFGPGASAVIAADGGLTIDHFDANWTNASRTVADMGTVTTIDINGGSIDGTVIGAAAVANGTFDDLAANGAFTIAAGQNKDFNITADANYAQGGDAILYQDATDGLIKASTNDGFLSAIAGSGLSVSSNKLTVVGVSLSASGWGDGNFELNEGLNYATTNFTSARTWTLPASPDAGDEYMVKAPSNCSETLKLNVTGVATHKFDGQAGVGQVSLESPYAALTFIYVDNNTWILM